MSADPPQDSAAPQPDAAGQSAAAPAAPRWQWLRRGLPLGIIAVEAVALVGLQYADNAEWIPRAEAFLTKVAIIALGTLLIFLWFVFLSPAPLSLRRRVGIAGVVLALGTWALVRPEGVTGDIHFHWNWRWAPRADRTLPDAEKQAANNPAVDLATTTPDDYPEYLGPGRLATLPNLRLASDWSSTGPKLLWRHPIGAGWSSFAIVGHYGVTQEQRGDEELVTCYDLDDGKLQWARSTPVRFEEFLAGVGPRATPTIDEGKVYALGATGMLQCLDGATGKLLWEHDVVTETGATPPQWGKSSSPLIYENLVITSAGGPDGKSLVAYDKQDGHLVWSAGDDASSYASPALMTLCDVPQIVMVNATRTSGHDPADGHILWERAWPESGMASPNVAQPLAAGEDRILLSKGYGVGSELWQIKHEGDAWSVEPIWRNNNLKTKMTNAVLKDGYAYGLDEGMLSCIEVETGRKKWKRSRYGHGQVVLVGDLLLVQSESGEIALVEASPTAFRELCRMTVVDGQSWNCPALAGDKLLVRTEQEVACYALPLVSP